MRAILMSIALTSLLLSACGPGGADVCGLSGVVPTTADVLDGRARGSQDGTAFDIGGTWAPGPSGSIDIGTLSMVIAVDETGTDVGDLVGRRAFPICIPLGERSETSGNASWDGSYITDSSHTGAVAILDEDAGFLAGRFEVTLLESGGAMTAFTDGVFRLPQR
jgi:hypothetical protein